MAGKKKPTALKAFEDNVNDAEALVRFAIVLKNGRVKRMRREKRESLGGALGIAKKHQDSLDCVESQDLFIVLKPGSEAQRDDFTEQSLEPLLRQSVVAAAAAFETYVVDRVMELLSGALSRDEEPDRLRAIPLTLGKHLDILAEYERPGWAARRIVEQHVQELASPSPSQVGKAFSLVGERDIVKRIDKERKVVGGATARALEAFCTRRNNIAHTGDRSGRGRAAITVAEVDEHLECVRGVVEAIDRITG